MNDQMKLGISLSIEGVAADACVAINSRLSQVCHSDVVFGSEGNSLPHVSVMLGNVRFQDIDRVSQIVSRHCRKIGPISLEFDPPERELTTGRYVMSSVRMSDEALAWRHNLAADVRELFADAGRQTTAPHLTLGVFSGGHVDIDSLLRLPFAIPATTVRWIDISASGPKGAKGNLLQRIRLDS